MFALLANMNELSIINSSLAFDQILDGVSSTELPKAKIRQFLRGRATWKAIQLLTGKRIQMTPHLLKGIGVLTGPYHQLREIGDAVGKVNRGEMTRDGFDRFIGDCVAKGRAFTNSTGGGAP